MTTRTVAIATFNDLFAGEVTTRLIIRSNGKATWSGAAAYAGYRMMTPRRALIVAMNDRRFSGVRQVAEV